MASVWDFFPSSLCFCLCGYFLENDVVEDILRVDLDEASMVEAWNGENG